MLYFNDIKLKKFSHTLSPAAAELGVSEDLIYKILRRYYLPVNAFDRFL